MSTDRLFPALADTGVVVVGGLAAVLHGASYVTADVDLCYDPSPDGRARLAVALAPFHPYPRGIDLGLPFVWDARTLRDAALLTLTTDVGDVDLLTEIPGVGTYDAVASQSAVLDVDGASIRVLALDALIAAKRAMGRPKDLALLTDLLALRALGG